MHHLFFRRLGVEPGQKLLDVGCGAGQLALIAARAGAKVTGCDIATNWLERARARASRSGSTSPSTKVMPKPFPTAMHSSTWSPAWSARCLRRVPTSLRRADSRLQARRQDRHGQLDTQGFVGQMFKIIAR